MTSTTSCVRSSYVVCPLGWRSAIEEKTHSKFMMAFCNRRKNTFKVYDKYTRMHILFSKQILKTFEDQEVSNEKHLETFDRLLDTSP